MYERAKAVYDDPEASKYVWGTGFHWYVGNHFDNVQRLHETYPRKHLLFTEGCQEGGPHIGEWQVGERYGRSIISDLNKWAEGWTDWNLILDFKGGPNHVGNLCSAPILVDGAKDSIIVNNSFYYLGHFSRFIRPGARRVTLASTIDDLEATAFLNKDNKIVVVVMNTSEKEIEFALRFDSKGAKTKSPAHSIITYVF
jgi:glucosylceramidase